MSSSPDHAHWMRLALQQAEEAVRLGEVPIGAVVVRDGKVYGAAHDEKELTKDPTAHAEVLAMRRAAEVIGDWRLDGMDLYVTLEPCPMCAGALLQARIKTLVFGASNKRWGACQGDLDILQNPRFNHRVEVISGVLEEECARVLKETFKRYRTQDGPR